MGNMPGRNRPIFAAISGWRGQAKKRQRPEPLPFAF